MNILVTGGTGFIGSRLVRSFSRAGHKVRFTGRDRTKIIASLHGDAEFSPGDLADSSFASHASKGIDAVIHCSGLAGTWGRYEDYHRANVQATELLLEGAKANGVQRVVNISSPSIYFDFRDQFNLNEEQRPPSFSNAYASTKYEAELLMRSYHCPALQTVSLRPRSVIGYGDKNILPRLLRLQEKGVLFQIGKGDNIVDITSIGNLIDAVSLCLDAPEGAMGETYNITNGQPERFWSFVEEVLRAAGMPIHRKSLPYGPLMLAAKANEAFNKIIRSRREPALLPISVGVMSFSMTLDISKARQKLGYRPRYSTSDGIREYFSRAPLD